MQNTNGVIQSKAASFPSTIKRKQFKEQFRKKYCEALLSNRVLIAEGRTEYDSIPAAARRLHELDPKKYSSLEALGIAVIDAETDSQIEPIATLLRTFGKRVYAFFDSQEIEQRRKIIASVDIGFESTEKSFENLLLNTVPIARLKAFALSLVADEEWPQHISEPTVTSTEDLIKDSLRQYFSWSKGSAGAANLLETCTLLEIPEFIRNSIEAIKKDVEPQPPTSESSAPVGGAD